MSNFMDSEVFKALQKGVLASVAACDRPDLPVQMLGRTYKPGSDDTTYLQVVIIPNNPENEQWGDNRSYAGLLRLILHYPNDNAGVYPPLDLLKSICEYFIKSRVLTDGTITVRITTPPNFIGDLPSGHETEYPVSMRYNFFQP